MSEFAAVVLAGGAARRMGGAPKPLLPVGGQSMLHTATAAVAGAVVRVVVGPTSLATELPAGVLLTLEEPPGGGPVSAMSAGLGLVPPDVDLVAVIAADQPFLTAAAIVRLLLAVDPDTDGAVYVDAEERRQHGCAVWRAASLRRRLVEIGPPAGVSMGLLWRGQRVIGVCWPDPTRAAPWFDCDTEDDLRRAEGWANGDAG
jgi:molybdopterin-guanine dinucleotide biosynthesis protein A